MAETAKRASTDTVENGPFEMASLKKTKAPAGTDKMKEIAANIQEGAMAFLAREYRVLAIFVVVVAALLAWAGSTEPGSSALVGLSVAVGATDKLSTHLNETAQRSQVMINSLLK